MNRTAARAAALLAGVSLALTGSIALAGAAAADTTDAPLVYSATPVDPQPVVAGHEGDVLLQVTIAMPAKAAKVAKVAKVAKSKAHR